MNTGVNSFNTQSLVVRYYLDRKYRTAISNLVEGMKKSDPIMEELMFLIYQGRFPLMEKKRDDEELFHIKQSNSQSEWVIHAREIAHMAPYSRPSILQEIYDSNKATHWDNEDDFCCFQYVGFYEGKKIRVMFYNSVSREDHNSKIPYRDWIQGDRSYIRICLD